MSSANGRPRLLVRGIAGFLEGEERWLAVGESLVVGRSRAADLSTRRARKLVEHEDAAAIVRSNAFNAVSRKHVRIHFLNPGLVEIRDLSTNGTFLDGERVELVALEDLAEETRVLALGRRERLHLQVLGGEPGD